MPEDSGITRRDFIQQTVGATAGLSLVGLSSCRQEPDGQSDRAAAAAGEPLEVLEGLFRPGATGCTIQWIARRTIEARVLAGSSASDLGVRFSGETLGPHEIEVAGFPEGSEYFVQLQYREVGAQEWTERPIRRVQTARQPGSSFQVAMIADSHVWSTKDLERAMENRIRTLESVAADKPDFVIFMGDEPGIAFRRLQITMSQDKALEHWRYWRQLTGEFLSRVPTFFVLGNRDGEAGFFQSFKMPPKGEIGHLQRWGTIARKRYFLNPSSTTYPEGGENAGWGSNEDSPALGGASEGNCSPLQNYYAWTWGDALFVVLDVHRYTNVGGDLPKTPDEWTLGPHQFSWLSDVLQKSTARWKCVLAHHLVGGFPYGPAGGNQVKYAYARGGAKYAKVGEQAKVSQLMRRYGAQFYFYGHDHVFAHQVADDINFICCGRPTYLNPGWWPSPGWLEAYGSPTAVNPQFQAAIGYTQLTVEPEKISVAYMCTGRDPQGAENVPVVTGQPVQNFVIT